jgi:demethylmenaquinone methyltransferase/2-methoxy-6-polyprenyl-1,4-benzoquinol methylase
MINSRPVTPQASEIRDLFNRIAPVYDQLNNGLSFGQHRVWKLMAVKWSQVQPGSIGLDVCCGSGDLAQLLARRVGSTGEVYGVDFSAALLEVASQRTPPQLPLHWVEADALNLPFADNYFDCATMGYGLRMLRIFPGVLPSCIVSSNQGQKRRFWTFIAHNNR